MRLRLLVLICLLSAASAPAQTFLRQLRPQSSDVYEFSTGASPVTVSLTVMWNRITADLAMELYCHTEFDQQDLRRGLAVSTHDRMMRLDVGLEGRLECFLYVETNATCAYAINFAWYGQLTLNPAVIPYSGDELPRRLVDILEKAR